MIDFPSILPNFPHLPAIQVFIQPNLELGHTFLFQTEYPHSPVPGARHSLRIMKHSPLLPTLHLHSTLPSRLGPLDNLQGTLSPSTLHLSWGRLTAESQMTSATSHPESDWNMTCVDRPPQLGIHIPEVGFRQLLGIKS